jgi:hypothetical protein
MILRKVKSVPAFMWQKRNKHVTHHYSTPGTPILDFFTIGAAKIILPLNTTCRILPRFWHSILSIFPTIPRASTSTIRPLFFFRFTGPRAEHRLNRIVPSHDDHARTERASSTRCLLRYAILSPRQVSTDGATDRPAELRRSAMAERVSVARLERAAEARCARWHLRRL